MASVTTPIHDFLKAYAESNPVRCHTPGHKGASASYDITEIEGAVSIIAESEAVAAKLFGAHKTLYSCSGSTLAVQAMLSLIKTVSSKNRIAAFRYAHRSFVSAALLLGFEVDWIYPARFMSAALTPQIIKSAINKDTAAVFINNIDYYGGVCDVENAAKACKEANIPLLADNAHGAYLSLAGRHPNILGAALVADSAHKTLPALTGAAYLHINNEAYTECAEAAMSLFGTSSPSYLILESLDLCNKHIFQNKQNNANAFKHVAELKQNLTELGFALKDSDLLRVTVNARGCGYSGFEFAGQLRLCNIECEYADENYTVLLFSTATTSEMTSMVLVSFRKISIKKPLKTLIYPVLKPKSIMSMRKALFANNNNCKYLPPSAAVGKICAEITAPCPPGVPLLMPGELIDEEVSALLKAFNVEKIRILEK